MPIGELPCQKIGHDHPADLCLTWRSPGMPVPAFYYGCQKAVDAFEAGFRPSTEHSRRRLGAKDLATIAAQYGYAFTRRGHQYIFTRGDIMTVFARVGYGELRVYFRGVRVPWSSLFEWNGRLYHVSTDKREEYAEALLATLAEEPLRTGAEKELRSRVGIAEHNLENAQERLMEAKAKLAWFLGTEEDGASDETPSASEDRPAAGGEAEERLTERT